ncbi:MAG: sucrase ferredoxin [Mobilicoccus sp.]|nr:sucrase ferredoxin [Mobilicoccus sp.]
MTPRVHARPPVAGSCAAAWTDVAEPAWGTASPARFWVALEQTGAWGNRAFVESSLDPHLGVEFERACASAGGRALLVRSVDAHRARRDEGQTPRTVMIAGGMDAGAPWLLRGVIEDPADILTLPFDQLAGGDPGPAMSALPSLGRSSEPVLLVCTNGKRDTCCAVLGRPVAVVAGSLRPGQVWECTHTGGHRFSPTAIVLPTGATLARLTTELAVEALDAADHHALPVGTTTREHLRGLSHLPPVLQAADAYVRTAITETDTLALHTSAVDLAPDPAAAESVVDVTHRDGRTWRLRIRKHFEQGDLRRNSCTSSPVPAESWVVRESDETRDLI